MSAHAATWTTLWLQGALATCAGLVIAGVVLCLVRAARGPREPDRLAAVALVFMLAVGLMAVLAVARADWRYLDIALVLSLLSGAIPIAVARASKSARKVEALPEEKDVTHALGD